MLITDARRSPIYRAKISWNLLKDDVEIEYR